MALLKDQDSSGLSEMNQKNSFGQYCGKYRSTRLGQGSNPSRSKTYKYKMNTQSELMLKVAIAAVGAYIASHLIYRLALEVWCIAYGLIY